jgi:hypothetical protein
MVQAPFVAGKFQFWRAKSQLFVCRWSLSAQGGHLFAPAHGRWAVNDEKIGILFFWRLILKTYGILTIKDPMDWFKGNSTGICLVF